MRTRIEFIEHRAYVNPATNGTDVVLHWQEFPTAARDPVTQSPGEGTPRSQTVKAFIRTAEATTAVRQFNEVEVGDLILDFPPNAPLDGKTGLYFTVNGRDWVQKEISGRLTQQWDTIFANTKLYRTLLLRPR